MAGKPMAEFPDWWTLENSVVLGRIATTQVEVVSVPEGKRLGIHRDGVTVLVLTLPPDAAQTLARLLTG